MDTQYRNLYDQIMAAVTETEGTPLDRPETLVTQVTEIDPSQPGMQAVKGKPVAEGLQPIPIRSGVYLTRTIHRRGVKEVSIYNICVMDQAGAVRVLLDIRADDRTKGFAQKLRTPITELIDEHANLNGTPPPTSNPTDAQPQPQPLTIDYMRMTANAQVWRTLRNSITMIAYWQIEHWPEWIVYLLKGLRDKTDLATYEEFLEEVGDAITTRIVTGLW